MHLHINFGACPMHSPFGFMHLTHQNLSARALFCLNSLAKINTQLLIYKYSLQILIKTRYCENNSFRDRDLICVTQCRMPSKFSDTELLHNTQVSI